MDDRPSWALPTGLPSLHVARAAVHAAAVFDPAGSLAADAHESYWHYATGGSFPPPDLRRGEQLLLDCGLLLERDGSLIPTSSIAELLAGSADEALAALCQRALEITQPAWIIPRANAERTPEDAQTPRDIVDLVPDAERREELLLALGRRFEDSRRRLIGEIGENLVVSTARAELQELGHIELARSVRRVSLTSDQLGYDVTAPRIGGRARLLEVKTTTRNDVGRSVTIYLSRGEADTGQRFGAWALVVCAIEDIDRHEARIEGWCQHAAIADSLPQDTPTGRWEHARLEVGVDVLSPGLPSPFA